MYLVCTPQASRLRIVDVGVDVGVIVDDLVGVVVDVDLRGPGRGRPFLI